MDVISSVYQSGLSWAVIVVMMSFVKNKCLET